MSLAARMQPSQYRPAPSPRGRILEESCSRVFTAFTLILLLIASVVFPFPFPATAEEQPPYHLLLLNSYHQGFRWTDDVTAAVISTMARAPRKVELHVEYMDEKRFHSDLLLAALERLFSLKYHEMRPDIIITSDDDALNFVKRHHAELFPSVPVVFCGVNDVQSALAVPKRFFTGLVETLDIRDNISLAIRLFPQTRQIVIVSDGTPTGVGTRQMARESEADFPGMEFIYLDGEQLSTRELLERLKGLRQGSVVIAPAWYRDRDGRVFDNTAIYPMIAEASPVPVMATSSANLGLGLLGGKVNSGAIQGQHAAELALRILSGQAVAADIPVETASHNRYMFDSRQLTRFGIDEQRLPAGSIVLHRPFSFYQAYRQLVWSVIAAFCLFTVMIIALLVTNRRLRDARGSLSRSEENLRITLRSIGDAVITTDTSGRITGMNPVAEKLTGWMFPEAGGRCLGEVLRLVNAVSRETCPDPVSSVLASGDTTALETDTILISRSGGEYRVADSGAPIRTNEGEIVGIVLVFRDITDEYLREEQQAQSRKLEAIGQLAGGVAHDFNNMLGGIIGNAEMLALKLGSGHPLQKHVSTILTASENAAGLTQRLLTFSRKGNVVIAPMDVHHAIGNALTLLEHSLDKGITIRRELNAAPSTIKGDPVQMVNSIINLCVNAGHAMPEGGVLTISTENVELSEAYCRDSSFPIEPGCFVRIGIRDTGEGIPQDLLPRIFEPFFTTKGVGKGTGLGLAAVYGTIREHHGCICVQSEKGVGTVFNLCLPVNDVSPACSAEEAEASGAAQHGCILIVDDEEQVRTVAADILESLGYRVLQATDGREGVEIFAARGGDIDLVLLDMVMPRMGGLACFREIRAIDPHARVLVTSGFARENSLEELQAAGIMGFLQKPYRRADLARMVAQAMCR